MATSELEGHNLGEKHRTYNKLLKEAFATTQMNIDEDQGNDINEIIKIDIACHKRDVEYILNIFKSKDILYVIRAVEKSTWLITDSKYSHIINATYLQNELFPNMTKKAQTKLVKHIKLYLKDETRVEEFYSNETDLKLAMKWLPNCSVTFIESNVHKHLYHMEPGILKRLCEKSFTIFKIIVQHDLRYCVTKLFESTAFLLRSHPQEYFEVINDQFSHNKFNAKRTKILMKNIPNQIMCNFLKCCRFIHIPTFIQFIKREDIKSFLLDQVNKTESAKLDSRIYINVNDFLNYDTIKMFIRRMPKNEQFNFVKEIFIDKSLADVSESSVEPTSETFAKIKLRKGIEQESYVWYEFANFDVAFTELKIQIPVSDIQKKYSILTTLTKCLEQNLEKTRILLKYFNDKHANDPIHKKYDFIKSLMLSTDVSKYDEETWNILDLIFKNMDVYAPIKDNDFYPLNDCIESIIIYKVIRGESVPEPVEKKFAFTTLKKVVAKLGNEEKINLFNFLFAHLFKKIENKVVANEEDFNIVVTLLENILHLLKDWNKELYDYPSVYKKIKELAKIKEINSWSTSLLSLYNVNKSWRKLFFEESVIINPCEEVCMNALKHDPQLLSRYKTHVEKLRYNNSISLQRVNRKLRIYWPQTLASEWNKAYLEGLDTVVESHKTLIRGLCVIEPLDTLSDMVKKYTPKSAKINWSETNEMELSMQRNISLNMHLSRPQFHPEIVLGYAKGDYLKYALPSVIAIFYNLNIPQSRENIPKLLNAPVSLQKHGIRFAFMKLKTEELKDICSNVWKNSNNATIRKVLFEFTHKLLCKDENASNSKTIWELLQSFIDNLSYKEDKSIYKLLPEIEKVPTSVKGEYFVKAYRFLQRLLQNTEKEKETYQSYIEKMISYTRDIIELLPQDFLIDMIQQLLDENFYKIKNKYSRQSAYFGVIPILSAYLLSPKDSEDQAQRYERLLLPLIQQSCALWDEPDKSYIRIHIQDLLKCFSMDLKNIVFPKTAIIPYKMFVDIQNELTKVLPLSHNYLLLTKWNLVVAFTKIMNEEARHSDDWDEFCTELAPLYGSVCLEYLQQETTAHFPRIYIIFTKALRQCLESFIDNNVAYKIYKSLLNDQNFIPGYLAGIDLLQERNYCGKYEEKPEVCKIFLAHPSVEVKMHFHCMWDKNPLIPKF